MANRFFKPGQSQYQSQFVPKTLPLAMMEKGLARKQATQDATRKDIDTQRANFNKERAYGTSHKAKLSEIEGKFDKFVDSNYNQDLTSPEFTRKYNDFTAEFKNNSDLSTIRARQANVDALTAEERTLRESGDLNSARYGRVKVMLDRANSDEDDFNDLLSGAIIGETQDVRTTKEQYFKPLKSEDIVALDAATNEFKRTGYKGVGELKVAQTVMRHFEEYMQTSAGEQEGMQYDEDVRLGRVDGEEVTKEDFIMGRFLATGEDFQYSNASKDFNPASSAVKQILEGDPIIVSGSKATHGGLSFQEQHGIAGKSIGNLDDLESNLEELEHQLTQYADVIELTVTEDNRNMIETQGAEGRKLLDIYDAQQEGLDPEMLTADEVTKFKESFKDERDAIQKLADKGTDRLNQESVRVAKIIDVHTAVLDNTSWYEGSITGDMELDGQKPSKVLEAYYGKQAYIPEEEQIQAVEFMDALKRLGTLNSAWEIDADATGVNMAVHNVESKVSSTIKQFVERQKGTYTNQLDNGKITQAEYKQAQEELINFKTVAYAYEAQMQVNQVIDDAKALPADNKFVEQYNQTRIQDTEGTAATMKPNKSTYTSYESDGTSGGAKTEPAYTLENNVRLNPTAYTFRDVDGVEIDVSKNYALNNASVVSIDVQNPDPNSDLVSFSLSVNQSVIDLDPTSIENLKTQGVITDDDFITDGNGDPTSKLNLEGLNEETLASLKNKVTLETKTLNVTIKDEFMDNSIKKAIQEKEMSLYHQSPNSEAGQSAYLRAEVYADPKFHADLKQINVLRTEESYEMERVMPYIAEGKKVANETFTYKVTKLPGTGANAGFLQIEMTGPEGVIAKGSVRNIGEVSSFVKQLESEAAIQLETLNLGDVYNPTAANQTEKNN